LGKQPDGRTHVVHLLSFLQHFMVPTQVLSVVQVLLQETFVANVLRFETGQKPGFTFGSARHPLILVHLTFPPVLHLHFWQPSLNSSSTLY